MNLISNTGIQLHTVPLEIDLNNNSKMFFHEWFDTEEEQLKLEIAHFFSDDEVWVKKFDLAKLGFAMGGNVTEPWQTIKDDFENEGCKLIKIETEDDVDSGCFHQSVSRIKWDKFENTWFPMPFFSLNGSNSEFGPTNWCRFKLIPLDFKGNIRKYSLLIAFDTRSTFEDPSFQDEDLNETPVFTNTYLRSKDYALCNNEYNLLAYCSQARNCDWVDNHVLKQFHNLDDINELIGQKPKLNYLSQYIFLLRFIQQTDVLPKITLFSNKNRASLNVDLVVDIGNSRTCAMLFDDGDFKKASPLILQDFTTPVLNEKLNNHTDPFDMRLAFREADFGGKLGIVNSQQFVYPSMIRLGKEANELIHNATNLNTGAEKTSTFSSPKRFLWDTKPQNQEWEFVQLDNENTKPIYIKGISEQLDIDGSLNTEGSGGVLTKYSRRALMTFAFLEILSQASIQINSYSQRSHWGSQSSPRKIRRIIVTSPTAMSKVEQISLRKCAEDAVIMLDRFFENTYFEKIDEKEARDKAQVMPSSKNLLKRHEIPEWSYDEATSAQFVFLYAEIGERYLKNIDEYFEIYGKVRYDLEGYNKKSLTIGSVDIGAGTTDLMIAAYKQDEVGNCSLTPVPLFWESFYKAGDDLMKELILQIVIQGKHSPIENKLKTLGKNPVDLLQPFLGTDTGVSFRNRQLRSSFNLQVSVPIISYFLEILKDDSIESKILTFNDIFVENYPTPSVLKHFHNHFGFEFETLNWQYEKKVVSAFIEKTFESIIGKISSLLSYYDCDIVLLSGRPTSLKPLSDLFLKHYAIAPNRLKTMNNYRVGKWYPQDMRYPYIDSNGNFKNPKSIITTGALIGYIAKNGGLNGFSLNLNELKEKLKPTTNYFGKLNDRLEYLETIISPETNLSTFEINSIPFKIGVRQLDLPSYPSRPFYTLAFNDFNIDDRVKGRMDDENNMNAVQDGIEKEKSKILNKMPLKVTISRDKNEDFELLRIEEVVDREGESLPKNFFTLQVQSMSELENYWLDSGIFSLNIQN